MSVGLYMDEHIDGAITEELTNRGIDVLTVQDDGRRGAPDEDVLIRSTSLGRLLFTWDHHFPGIAARWQRSGRDFHGILFGRDPVAPVGDYVRELEIIAVASTLEDWSNRVTWIPL